MIDRDLAELYGVETKKLNQSVKRNIARFPIEFMFKLTDSEFVELVTNCDRFKTLKHSSSTPYAFTEHGIAMLSSVLNSERAIIINIHRTPQGNKTNWFSSRELALTPPRSQTTAPLFATRYVPCPNLLAIAHC